MTTEAILSELRKLPGAPESLRERVGALPEPKPRLAWTLPRLDVRRSLLVIAPAAVALGVGAAALHGLLEGGAKNARPVAGEATHWKSVRGGSTTQRPVPYAMQHLRAIQPQLRDQAVAPRAASTPRPFSLKALPPSATRLNKYNAWLRIRVEDARLANVTTRAMRIARGYGGYVASVDMNTPASRGTASLVLRVPVTRVEDAVLGLGKLGDVTAQRVRIQDLQRQADVLQRDILRLRTTIAQLERKLGGNLSPAVRVRLQYRLDEAKRSLAEKTRAHTTTVREGTLATISLSFFTPQPAAAKPHHEGRLEGTLRSAGDFLVRELSWLLYALIVIGPIALFAAAIVAAVRTARRRSDARVLEST